MRYSIPTVSIISLLSVFCSCSGLRQFSYPLTDANKAVIKNTFTRGTVSCTDGYCWQITKESSDNSSYKLEGARILAMSFELVAIKKGENKFRLDFIARNFGFRMHKLERLFLKELQHDLFEVNKPLLEEEVKNVIDGSNKKTARKKS